MKLFYLLVFTVYLLICVSCRSAASPISVSNQPISINNVPQTNLPLPSNKDIEKLGWKTSSGEEKKISDYRGKVVVLDFWATYCPPCLEEIPHLVNLQNKYREQNFEVIGLHVGGEEDLPRVPAFIEKLKMNYVLAFPEDKLTNVLFGGQTAIPQTFVVDRNGNLVEKFVGYDLKVKNRMEKAIEKSLAK
ncbi:MAG: TlpA disulfide reductase family protein [Pyrinomonadaceae bacterium]|jgi:thiol-disulfide isomerase/thioredoxin|nr:TlpA family protein disulfide reductase [Acidobacteriota bacterium]